METILLLGGLAFGFIWWGILVHSDEPEGRNHISIRGNNNVVNQLSDYKPGPTATGKRIKK